MPASPSLNGGMDERTLESESEGLSASSRNFSAFDWKTISCAQYQSFWGLIYQRLHYAANLLLFQT